MKNASSKIVTGCLLIASFVGNSFGQAPMKTNEEGGKKPVKIEKTKVPVVVTEKFFSEYPLILNEGWYGYPVFDYENDWYSYDPYLTSEVYPEYYVVEFVTEEKPYKVIYDKTGKKITSHQMFKTDLPNSISEAIGKGKYKSWKLVKEHEQILRDADKMKVYKVVVEKGTSKHALYFHKDGKLVKDKTLKS